MKNDEKLSFATSSEFRDEVASVAASYGVTVSEFLRRAVIHAVNERPALSSRSGMQQPGRPHVSVQ